MRFIGILVLGFLLYGCSKESIEDPTNLASLIALKSVELQLDEVIACAASSKTSNSVDVFYYPISGARSIQYFETKNTNVDPNNFSNYEKVQLPSEQVFGGYLGKFLRQSNDEVFCIVTYETDGKFHKSNPIRLKQVTKPTEYSTNVSIDFPQSLMPAFSWQDGIVLENVIYFQVISNASNQLISGTYTVEKQFQYYNLNNVVLHINRSTPENLLRGESYNFTLMGVSIDNWVNLVIEKPFVAQ